MKRLSFAFLLTSFLALPCLCRAGQIDVRELVVDCRDAYTAASKPTHKLSAEKVAWLLRATKGKYRPGSMEYAGLAYVQVMYGLDPKAGLHRLLFAQREFTSSSKTLRWELLEALPSALSKLYGITGSRAVIRQLVLLRGDGHYSELLADAWLEVLLRHPKAFTEAASHDKTAKRIILEDLSWLYQDDAQAITRLKRLLSSPSVKGSGTTTRFVKELLKRIEHSKELLEQ